MLKQLPPLSWQTYTVCAFFGFDLHHGNFSTSFYLSTFLYANFTMHVSFGNVIDIGKCFVYNMAIDFCTLPGNTHCICHTIFFYVFCIYNLFLDSSDICFILCAKGFVLLGQKAWLKGPAWVVSIAGAFSRSRGGVSRSERNHSLGAIDPTEPFVRYNPLPDLMFGTYRGPKNKPK